MVVSVVDGVTNILNALILSTQVEPDTTQNTINETPEIVVVTPDAMERNCTTDSFSKSIV